MSVEHVGSTAVPGLAAKPFIDVAVAAAPRGNPEAALRAIKEANRPSKR